VKDKAFHYLIHPQRLGQVLWEIRGKSEFGLKSSLRSWKPFGLMFEFTPADKIRLNSMLFPLGKGQVNSPKNHHYRGEVSHPLFARTSLPLSPPVWIIVTAHDFFRKKVL